MLSITRLPRYALNVLLPPRCLACDVIVRSNGTLCAACWQGLQFTPDTLATGESQDLPMFHFTCSALAYNDASRQLILRLKHGRGERLAPRLGEWLWQAGRDLWPRVDGLLPIPLHWQRLALRRYNQAALIAQEVSLRADVPIVHGVLHRSKATLMQKHMHRAARQANMAAAFAVNPLAAKAWQGKHVVLIDDVWTTGATLTIAAQTLLDTGIGAVSVATVARVLRQEN